MVLLTLRRRLHELLRPALDALFARNLPFSIRWRLLALQPIWCLTYSIARLPHLFREPWVREEWIPVGPPGHHVRTLVFHTPGTGRGRRLRPLHVQIHGGGFIGGCPEDNAFFCDRLARETGAVVVSITYRFAPVNPFPAAIDDVDGAVRYLQEHAEERYGADATLMTIGGDSAGGNLALAAAQQPGCHAPAATSLKGSVTFYGAMDLRLMPQEKPVPANYPTKDPMSFLLPLYDTYAGPARSGNLENPRMSPIVAQVETLPESMFVGVVGIDILVHEQEEFVKRVSKAFDSESEKHAGRRVEMVLDPKGFHGYLSRKYYSNSAMRQEAIPLTMR